jgi:hypothetical protein
MVELFAIGLFGRTPSIVVYPVACVTAYKLPTAAKVERAESAFVPNPPEGLVPIHRDITHLSATAGPAVQSVPVAPIQ